MKLDEFKALVKKARPSLAKAARQGVDPDNLPDVTLSLVDKAVENYQAQFNYTPDDFAVIQRFMSARQKHLDMLIAAGMLQMDDLTDVENTELRDMANTLEYEVKSKANRNGTASTTKLPYKKVA